MNLRHTAALALMGWYLMTPPTFDNQLRVNVNAPITKWAYFQSYDSAKECEDVRTSLGLKMSRKFTQDQQVNPRTKEQSAAT